MSNKQVIDFVREALREEDNNIVNAIFRLEEEQEHVPEELHDTYRMAINLLYDIDKQKEQTLENSVNYILPAYYQLDMLDM